MRTSWIAQGILLNTLWGLNGQRAQEGESACTAINFAIVETCTHCKATLL